ncbi:MAG: type VI secretion system tip protein VgrG [Draconibacterium sp.]
MPQLQPVDGPLTFEILINGSPLKDTIEIEEISMMQEVNRICFASIELIDGAAIGVSEDAFSNSEGDDFVPGNEIEIKLGYSSNNTTVFKGIITSQSLSVKNSCSQLRIECKDKAIKMTKIRSNALFTSKKDSDAITSVIGNSGLSNSVDTTTFEHPALMQYNATDWDFIVTRAEANGMMVVTNQNEVNVKKFDFSAAPVVTLTASEIIIDIDLKLDSEHIAANYDFNSWAEANQTVVNSSEAVADGPSQGNLTAKKLSDVCYTGNDARFSSTSATKDETSLWSEAAGIKAALSKIRGYISVQGNSLVTAGNLVELSGFSDRFNGNAFVSGVTHTVAEGSWITKLQIGMISEWHASLPDVQELPASGLLPAISGTQIGVVKKIDEDPGHNFRVQINLPVLTGTGMDEGIWARLAFPYAGSQAGFFFFPEVGDEVLVNFINNDPRYPVIVGSVYSSANKPKEDPVQDNQYKSIYFKSGIKIRIDDTDKILTIDTPAGNSFIMDDKNKGISVVDQNGNSLKMDDSGITMKSGKDINITATGNLNLTGSGGVNIKSDADVKADGMNVQLTAQVGFTGKGNATAEVSASGQTTVKGAMVMIN